jgi:SAM-dependent methyltransferase
MFEELFSCGVGSSGATLRKRAWLLGLTSEIAAAPWMGDIDVVAVEKVQAMIDAAWAGNTGRRWAIRADWLHAPFPDESFDLVIGDGCLTVVGYPEGLTALLASVHRCLRPDGQLMLRLFCLPDLAETPEAVMAALRAGEIGRVDVLKWRLVMAVQGMAGSHDVCPHDAWTVWNQPRWNARDVAERLGWSAAEVGTIEYWRGSSARHVFMRLDETTGHLRRAGFELVAARTGSYELAERCPVLLLRKRQVEAA